MTLSPGYRISNVSIQQRDFFIDNFVPFLFLILIFFISSVHVINRTKYKCLCAILLTKNKHLLFLIKLAVSKYKENIEKINNCTLFALHIICFFVCKHISQKTTYFAVWHFILNEYLVVTGSTGFIYTLK